MTDGEKLVWVAIFAHTYKEERDNHNARLVVAIDKTIDTATEEAHDAIKKLRKKAATIRRRKGRCKAADALLKEVLSD